MQRWWQSGGGRRPNTGQHGALHLSQVCDQVHRQPHQDGAHQLQGHREGQGVARLVALACPLFRPFALVPTDPSDIGVPNQGCLPVCLPAVDCQGQAMEAAGAHAVPTR